MGLDHLGITVPRAKFDETVAFYLATLAPLGYREMLRPVPNVVGLGVYHPDFWISCCPEGQDEDGDTSSDSDGDVKNSGLHFAFSTRNRNVVHAFHDAALKAGGKCNGKPGLRPQYMRWYYGGFVLDPAGNNVETVCIWPGWTHLGYWFGMGAAFGKQKTN